MPQEIADVAAVGAPAPTCPRRTSSRTSRRLDFLASWSLRGWGIFLLMDVLLVVCVVGWRIEIVWVLLAELGRARLAVVDPAEDRPQLRVVEREQTLRLLVELELLAGLVLLGR